MMFSWLSDVGSDETIVRQALRGGDDVPGNQGAARVSGAATTRRWQ
ncbi:MAG: hypothetical protein V4724_38760 [Pseudomonadota bacterium]